MKLSAVVALFILSLGLFAAASVEDAQAARIGGGRSFGSKPFMSTPTAPPPMTTRPAPQASRDAGAVNNPAQTPQGRGMFGGMGGLFGGLLAGTLLGSLLSGHGFAGGGFLDILIIGFLIYLALKFFAKRRVAEAPASGQNSAYTEYREASHENNTGWSRLRSGKEEAEQSSDQTLDVVPPGFDQEEFLRGAKMVYARLQNSWDKRDMVDIADFTTSSVLEQLREDLKTDPVPSTTELLLINAQLLHVEKSGQEERAEVFFDVLMRETPDQTTPSSVKEIWHFLRIDANDTWKLDGIQQVK